MQTVQSGLRTVGGDTMGNCVTSMGQWAQRERRGRRGIISAGWGCDCSYGGGGADCMRAP